MATWRALALGSTSLLRWELTPGNVGQQLITRESLGGDLVDHVFEIPCY